MSNQLIKETSLGFEKIFPKNYILNLKDKDSGKVLSDILKSFNMLFLNYTDNKSNTRKQVPISLRHGGLWITYIIDKTIITEWYNGTAIDDYSWGSDVNWREGSNMLVGDISISKQGTWVINGEDSGITIKGDKGDSPVIRIYDNKILVSYNKGVTYEDLNNTPVYTKFRFNSLTNTYLVSYDLGANWQDISDEKVYHKFRYNSTTNTYLESIDFGKTWSNISAEKVYYQFRYNEETNTHLVSTDLGLNWTDISSNKVYYQFRTNDNRLLVSTDLGTTWENCSEPIAAWFRWADTSGTGNVGKVLISRDNNTWSDLSPTMTNNLYIKGYVSNVGNLPSNAAIGDIYMVGPTYDESDTTHDYPHYRMWVKLSSGWVDNGEFTNAGPVSTSNIIDNAITPEKLDLNLQSLINNISKNSSFAGIATPTTNPNIPDGPVFYLATEAGTYSNFNDIVINSGEAVILEWKDSWVKKDLGFATQEKLSELDSKVGVNENYLYEVIKDSEFSKVLNIPLKEGENIKLSIKGRELFSSDILLRYDDWTDIYRITKNGTFNIEIKKDTSYIRLWRNSNYVLENGLLEVGIITGSYYLLDNLLDSNKKNNDEIEAISLKFQNFYKKTDVELDNAVISVQGNIGEKGLFSSAPSNDWLSSQLHVLKGDKISFSGFSVYEEIPVLTIIDKNSIIRYKSEPIGLITEINYEAISSGTLIYNSSSKSGYLTIESSAIEQIENNKEEIESLNINVKIQKKERIFDINATDKTQYDNANDNILHIKDVYGNISDLYKNIYIKALVIYQLSTLLAQLSNKLSGGVFFNATIIKEDWDKGIRKATVYILGKYLTLEFEDTAYEYCLLNSGWGKVASKLYPRYVEDNVITEKIYDFSNRTKAEIEGCTNKQNLSLINPSVLVINPDNICKGIGSNVDFDNHFKTEWNLPCEVLNPNTNMGRYFRVGWDMLENEEGYNFEGYLEKILLDCAKKHTRLTLGHDQFSGKYGNTYMSMPVDYIENKDVYDSYMSQNSLSFDSYNMLVKNGKKIKDGYPNKYFWAQIKDGCYPVLTDEGETYGAYMNYNSDSIYTAWYNLNQNLNEWLNNNLIDNGKEFISDLKCSIKRLDMIESIMVRWGITGEGAIYVNSNNPKGVFPTDIEKAYRWFEMYKNIFQNIPISMPLAITYDMSAWGVDYVKQIFNIENNMGKCGLEYDMIGQDTFDYYFTIHRELLEDIGFTERKIHGETCPRKSYSPNNDGLLTHAFNMRLSGASLHNITMEALSPLSKSMIAKYLTIQGAKLYISDFNIYESLISISIQNIGYCKLWSRFWEPMIIVKDKDGTRIDEFILNIDLNSINCNSNEYENWGIINPFPTTFLQNITFPEQTKYIYFCIRDKYGIYENYYLHNYGRTEDGLYLLKSL